MMLTEEQAKDKWCPFARSLVTVENEIDGKKQVILVGSANRFEGRGLKQSDGGGCLGSECMAWRWGKKEKDGPGATTTALPKAEWQGSCGLAGAGE